MSMINFPGCLVVMTSPSNVGGSCSNTSQGIKIPHASWPKKLKHKNRGNIEINSIKTCKMVHIKKKKTKKINKYL